MEKKKNNKKTRETKTQRVARVYNEAIEIATNTKAMFFEDITAKLGISRTAFYDYFEVGSDRYNNIKEIIEKNKIDIKMSMRAKWYQSDSPILQIGLYKLIGTDDERAILNQQDIKLSGSVNSSVTSKQTVVFKTREKKSE